MCHLAAAANQSPTFRRVSQQEGVKSLPRCEHQTLSFTSGPSLMHHEPSNIRVKSLLSSAHQTLKTTDQDISELRLINSYKLKRVATSRSRIATQFYTPDLCVLCDPLSNGLHAICRGSSNNLSSVMNAVHKISPFPRRKQELQNCSMSNMKFPAPERKLVASQNPLTPKSIFCHHDLPFGNGMICRS